MSRTRSIIPLFLFGALLVSSAKAEDCANNLTLKSAPSEMIACLQKLGAAIETSQNVPAGAATDPIPDGAVMAFDLDRCPSGWDILPNAQGRYLVGSHIGKGTSAEVGISLSYLENRIVGKHEHELSDAGAHTHGMSSGGNHSHSYRSTDNGTLNDNRTNFAGGAKRFGTVGSKTTTDSGAHVHDITGSGSHKHEVKASGEKEGTNAPYITFLICKKVKDAR